MENQNRNLVKETISNPSILEIVKKVLTEQVGISLKKFATLICEKLGLKNAKGDLQVANCTSALKALAAKGIISLQENLNYKPRETKHTGTPKYQENPVAQPVDVPDSVDKIQNLHLVLVSTEEQKKILYTVLRDEHEVGPKLPPGHRICYLVYSEHGLLGAVTYSSAANRIKAREEWIGWTDQERKEKLDCVMQMSRLLIRKDVHCQNLGSKMIKLSLEQMQKDCFEKYHFSPCLVETFVDTTKHDGCIYKASNWEYIGDTKGLGWDAPNNIVNRSKKAIYIKTLVSDFRERLQLSCLLPKKPEWSEKGSIELPTGAKTEEWTEQEFGNAPLGHKDRNKRLVYSAKKLSAKHVESAHSAMAYDSAARKGWYKFIDSPQNGINFQNILGGHEENTYRRMMDRKVVLCVSDFTEFDTTSKPMIQGMGPRSKNQTGATSLGYFLFTTLSIDPEIEVPLGIVDAQYFARPTEKPENKLNKVPIEERESIYWANSVHKIENIAQYMPDTTVVHVCDRGADISSYIHECVNLKHCKMLVRASHNRNIPGEHSKIFNLMQATDSIGKIQITVPRQSERPKLSGKAACEKRIERTATLDIITRKVKIAPSPEMKGKSPVEVTSIAAIEQNPPKGADGIEWYLYTTLPVETFEDAVKCIQYYTKRWAIEEWHRVLKSGCHVESMQYKTLERITRALAVYMVIAWRIMFLLSLGKTDLDLPAELFFDKYEIKVLQIESQAEAKKEPKEEAEEGAKKKVNNKLSFKEGIKIIAKMGGYVERRDSPPGYKVFWRGYILLQDRSRIIRKNAEFDFKDTG